MNVGCPIPGSLGSFEVVGPHPPSSDHLSPGLSAWLNDLESQPSRAPPVVDEGPLRLLDVDSEPQDQASDLCVFQKLIAELGFEAAAMATFPGAAGRTLPLPWGFRELGRRIRLLGFAAAMASDFPRRLCSTPESRSSSPQLEPPPTRWPSPEPT